jgi:hypothetical protein
MCKNVAEVCSLSCIVVELDESTCIDNSAAGNMYNSAVEDNCVDNLWYVNDSRWRSRWQQEVDNSVRACKVEQEDKQVVASMSNFVEEAVGVGR